MTLYNIENENEITQIPYKESYDAWRRGLTDEEYKKIEDELALRIHGTEIQTSGWIPGNDWTGTVFQPIYEKACEKDFKKSGLFFGLIVRKFFMDHPDDWSFGKYYLNDREIGSTTYFRINRS